MKIKKDIPYDIYDQITREIDANLIIRSVWARAESNADGCPLKTRGLYIRYRSVQLMEERDAKQSEQRKIDSAIYMQKAHEKVSCFFDYFWPALFLLASVFLALGTALMWFGMLVAANYWNSEPIVLKAIGFFSLLTLTIIFSIYIYRNCATLKSVYYSNRNNFKK